MKNEINSAIQRIQTGQTVSFAEIYTALEQMPCTLIRSKKKQQQYILPEFEWEQLLDAATDGLVKAIQKYDYKKNDSIEAWAYKIMEQQFNKKLNSIIRKRLNEEKSEFRKMASSKVNSTEAEKTIDRKSQLKHLDYEVLEFIIECNRSKDAHGNPFCPNSSDIIGKERFLNKIKCRTTLSNSIRRLKNAGYVFADKTQRDSNQGYLILNPMLYTDLSLEEKLALDLLNSLLPEMTEGSVKDGINMIIQRLKKDYSLPQNTKPLILDGESIAIEKKESIISVFNNRQTIESRIFTKCHEAVKSGRTVNVIHRKNKLTGTCTVGKAKQLTFSGGKWMLSLKTENHLTEISLETINDVIEE